MNNGRKGRFKVAALTSWMDAGHLSGIRRYAAEHGWILHFMDERPDVFDFIQTWRPDGVLCQVHHGSPNLVRTVESLEVPAVSMTVAPASWGMPQVLADMRHAMTLLADHLAERSFPRVVVCTVKAEVKDALSRGPKLQAALACHGMSAEMLLYDDAGSLQQWGLSAYERCVVGPSIFGLVRPLLQRVIESGVQTAVYAPYFHNALELLDGCRDLGIQVPEQIALCTDTDEPVTGGFAPMPLTNISHDYERHAYAAAEVLHRRMTGEDIAAGILDVPIARLYVMDSTDTLACQDMETALVLRYIAKQYKDPGLCPSTVAEHFGVSLRTLQYRFKQHLRRGLMEAIQFYRVTRAEEMIVHHPGQSLREVAAVCGFTDSRHMRRTFLRVKGTPPPRPQDAGRDITTVGIDPGKR